MKTRNCLIYNFILLFLFFLTFQNISAQNPTFDSLANEINKISGYKKTKAHEMIDSLYQMSYNNPERSLLVRCFYEEALFNTRHGIIDTLLAEKIKNRLNNGSLSHFEQALLQSAYGLCFISEGKFSDAFEFQLKALENFKKTGNTYFIAKTLNIMGNICHIINLFNLAKNYYLEALSFFSPEDYEYYFIKGNLILEEISPEFEVDSAIHYIEILENKGYNEMLISDYNNISSIFLSNDNYDKAFEYLIKLQNLDFDNHRIKSMFSISFANYYRLKKEYDMALNYMNDAQLIMGEYHEYYRYWYNDMSLIYEDQNMYDSALYYSRKHEEFTQQLRSNTIAIETHQKYITTLLDVKEKDLTIAKQKNELKNRQIVIILIIFLLAISLFFIFYQRNRRKNSELTSKLKLQKLEQEKQDELLDAKIREITSYSTLVSNKNDLLNQIIKFNDSMLDNKENMSVSVNKINRIIKENINIDNEWENFKLHFDKVHPHFFEKLKQECTNLTEGDLKICAYINMGMTQKQIAQILHVVPDSIQKRIYRLKKKLNLTESDSLIEFIYSVIKK